MSKLRLEALSEKNFADYEALTRVESGGGCYCSFWHQKWTSMSDWETAKKEKPELNRSIVFEKMRSGFHVGALAYDASSKCVAWISVGPLTDFYWTWKRGLQLGEEARNIAGITCLTISPEARGQGLQREVLLALADYAREKKWAAVEGYPFDPSTLEKQKENALWPGLAKHFAAAGFVRSGAHWINHPEWERSIYRLELFSH